MTRDSTQEQIKEPANGRRLMLANALTLGFAAGRGGGGLVIWVSCSAERCGAHGHRCGGVGDLGSCRMGRSAWPFAEALLRIRSCAISRRVREWLFMLAVITAIIVQAVSRFANPIAVQGEAVKTLNQSLRPGSFSREFASD